LIASLAFKLEDEEAVAVLGDDARWTCPKSQALAATLNALYSPADDGPALGELGISQVRAAAEWLDATITWEDKRPNPKGAQF
jgi:hypothetical protein